MPNVLFADCWSGNCGASINEEVNIIDWALNAARKVLIPFMGFVIVDIVRLVDR